ncbi:unnamed protein product [Linum trigynum]|uniref:Uncharacterized protein n=1 Tax=Linum trigynum TaxID=586398 RepID=A0AAV2G926_9ROSI
MRREQVERCTEAAPALRRARDALPACALAVKSAASQTAIARLALTSLRMRKLEEPFLQHDRVRPPSLI